MSAPPLVSDEEVYSLSPAELRFREACQFYALFKRYHGPDAGLKGNRFLWMCYVDAFLTAIVSVKDLTSLRSQLNASDAFRFIVVMRNITAHQAVVSVASPVSMVVRDIHVQAGRTIPTGRITRCRSSRQARSRRRSRITKPSFGRRTSGPISTRARRRRCGIEKAGTFAALCDGMLARFTHELRTVRCG